MDIGSPVTIIATGYEILKRKKILNTVNMKTTGREQERSEIRWKVYRRSTEWSSLKEFDHPHY